ncbi:sensor histidine kinase [Mesoterricola silvestris]|uniref:histidine kinase n=1 Tax=Mesoterricola silvestris TaxID=2927979 RepID=A0AA48H5D7_9BACT|nr:sensor histidine kinase [Mesoterricola silvestris]BDU72168.1 GGDEF domain-containing protein [Mesoterricola silvestris]
MRLRLLLLVMGLVLDWGWAASPRPVPPGRTPFQVYGPKDGLTSLNAVALAQDHEGFLWVGTLSGLYQFDGVRFRCFGLREGLPAASIAALLVGRDGTLWVGTRRKGLARRSGDGFEYLGPGQGLPRTGFKGIAQGGDGGIWVATSEGLFHSPDGRTFAPVPSWPGGPALAVAAAAESGLVWASGCQEIHALSLGGLRVSYGRGAGFKATDLLALAVDRSGNLWVRTTQALSFLSPRSSRFRNPAWPLPPARNPSLHVGPSGEVLVNSDEGIHLLRGDGSRGVERVIKADSPYCSLVDQEGSTWIGSRHLSRALGGGTFEVYASRDGLPCDLMWGIHRSGDGALWVATQKGVSRATARGWDLLPGTRGKDTRCLSTGPDGALWIGQREGPPLRLDPATRKLEAFGPGSGFRGKGVNDILADRRGGLWLTQQEGGLCRAFRSGRSWRFEEVQVPRGTPNENMFGIVQDSAGRVWVAGEYGLAVFDGAAWRRYTLADGLRDDALYQLAALPDGRIAVAYREALGASLLRITGGRLEVDRHLDKGTGLAGDHVYLLGVDSRERLWLGTGTGASVLDGDHLDSFTTGNGLAGDDCDALSFLGEADGSVWIGSNTGLSHFRTPTSVPALPPPRSLIRELFASGNPVAFDPSSRLTLPRDQNTLDFQVSALTFLNAANAEHEVRLLGLEKEWQPLQGRSARYPSLPPGAYTFMVRSRRPWGDWGPPAALVFQVLPAWWERPGVRALAWALATGLVAGVLALRFRLLKRRNAALQEKVDEATAEIRSKAETLERANLRLSQSNEDKTHMLGIVAHDLRNPLHTIQLHAEMLAGETDVKELEEGSAAIQRISLQLQEMIQHLLDLSHLEAGGMGLQMEWVEPLPLVESVFHMYAPKAAAKGIRFEIEPGAGLPPLRADPFYLREVLDNLVSNAVKFTPPGPPVRRVRAVLAPGVIEIRDEGPGFNDEDLGKVFGRYTRLSARPTAGESSTGLGLSIVKAIVEAMAGEIELESAPGQGSTFRLRWKI